MNLDLLLDIASRLCVQKGWAAPEYVDNGASAAVYQTTTAAGPRALKIYDPEYFTGENAVIEESRIALQSELKNHGCPNLVQVYDAGKIEEDSTWYLIMEFCNWSSLDRRLFEVPADKIHGIIGQLVRAVQFLDSKGLVHRDIKPANIVISDDFLSLKLLDFGVMRRIGHDEGNGTDGAKFIATAQYSPPEFLTREEAPGQAGFEAINVYQIGAVLHDLITGSEIFGEEKATKNKFILFKAVTEKQPRVVSEEVPPRLIALCLAALDKSPDARVKSVKLEDFLADADDLQTLRRRVAASTASSMRSVPAVASWKSQVRSWGSEAAKLESDALGAITMQQSTVNRGVQWKLTFAGTAAPIFLNLVRQDDVLAVSVASAENLDSGSIVFVIDSEGPDLPITGIPGALAAQYLYALDLAIAARRNDSLLIEERS